MTENANIGLITSESEILDMFVDDEPINEGNGAFIDDKDLYKWMKRLIGDFKTGSF